MKGFGVIGGGAVLFAASGLAGSAILPLLGEPTFAYIFLHLPTLAYNCLYLPTLSEPTFAVRPFKY